MANLNKVMLIGNLTRDPQLKYLPSGTPVCEIGLAINRTWRDQQSGETREQTTYVDCQIMGRRAEILNQYVSRGSPLFVEGRLNFRSWEAKDGSGKRSKLDVVIENFEFLGGRREGGGGQGGGYGGGGEYGGGQGGGGDYGGGQGGGGDYGGGQGGGGDYGGGYQRPSAPAGGGPPPGPGGGEDPGDDVPF